jgi:hypothetical protein
MGKQSMITCFVDDKSQQMIVSYFLSLIECGLAKARR